jgi:hypothetical protein
MIPEPAAFLSYSMTRTQNTAEASMNGEKPIVFDALPSDIEPESIGALVSRYQATDVLPPPEEFMTVADQAKVGGGDNKMDYDHGAQISIPSGYQAVYATVNAVVNIWEDSWSVDAMVGGETSRINGDSGWTWGTSIANHLNGQSIETGGAIAWGFNTFRVSDGVVGLEVLCRITDKRFQQWQLDTHGKLMTAYKARLSEYEEKLARMKIDQGITIHGT